jgi:BirA family transcriptional regulator, biotin operon repressor / biotin---[acetyl-CoA-carboxylase] ligase
LTSAPVTHLAEVGSTNDWLMERVAELPDGHWVRADRQTAGRGRRGRVWNDGAGNLMTSVLVKAKGPVQQLSFVAAVALREAIIAATNGVQGLSPCPPEALLLKWPNDLLLNGRKVSGILLEGSGEAVIIGLGVNLASHPEGTERPATSLGAAGIALGPRELHIALVASFAVWRERWARQGFAPVRAEWLRHAGGLGERIVARLGDESIEGRFDGLDGDGALLLGLDDGATRAIHAGEVFSL